MIYYMIEELNSEEFLSIKHEDATFKLFVECYIRLIDLLLIKSSDYAYFEIFKYVYSALTFEEFKKFEKELINEYNKVFYPNIYKK